MLMMMMRREDECVEGEGERRGVRVAFQRVSPGSLRSPARYLTHAAHSVTPDTPACLSALSLHEHLNLDSPRFRLGDS